VKFFLGLHQPADAEKTRVSVFISMARLINRKKRLDHDDWIMDSGGFTMISKHGNYTVSEDQYLACVERHNPTHAFCQDWMCEEFILKKTGLSVKEHQNKTIESYLSLSKRDDRIRPVLQGWLLNDYLDHIGMYVNSGINMDQLFGLGTVCSRNSKPNEIFEIVAGIKRSHPEIRLHGFGVKTESLAMCAGLLESADSMAWSSRGRRMKLCPDCDIKSCANCLEFALLWRKRILMQVKNYTPLGNAHGNKAKQLSLF
jgi:hypothetical protein